MGELERVAALSVMPEGYAEWLANLKRRVSAAQQRAALAVNTEQLRLYWHVGNELLDRQMEQGWGAKVIDRLSHDLQEAFPEMRGFSSRNLRYMRDFAKAWPSSEIWQQAVAKLPWGHNVVLLTKLKNPDERLAYAAAAVEYGWSRNVLEMHIQARTVERTGQSLNNFEQTLPKPLSDLARESLKNRHKLNVESELR